MSATFKREMLNLMKPALMRAAEEAERIIQAERARISNILRTRYDAGPVRARADLPMPRLQLRWEEPGDNCDRTCYYELVFKIDEHDIRNDAKSGACVVELSRTHCTGGNPLQFVEDIGRETPFRDGAHAHYDSIALNGIPVYVIAPDGRSAIATGRN